MLGFVLVIEEVSFLEGRNELFSWFYYFLIFSRI